MIFKRIKKWLDKDKPVTELRFKNWSVVDIKSSQYQILQKTESDWEVQVLLFFNELNEQSLNITFKLTFLFENPILLFKYLQLLGPIFPNTSHQVAIFNIKGQLLGILDLKKTTTEQLKNAENNISNTTIVPTNEGSLSIN